ncbi:MAG TPA: DUF1285 domain-containing protein [Stellaceae bacterium]|jgi:hypothetical protein|nr:DUF1285 domain-containing protein [Stellaceae bacterium]
MENPASGNSSANRGPAAATAEGCGEFDIRIAHDGTWFYQGSPIQRLPLVKLFASVLRREGGDYLLVTPVERGRIVVEDVPFIAVAMDAAGQGKTQTLSFTTNLDEIVPAGPEHPLRVETAEDGEPSPYILVRPGLEARLARPVFYELVDLAAEEEVDGERQFGVWSGGMFFCLGDPGEEE